MMEKFSWLALLEAEIGDIIEIKEQPFSHWAIYAGKDKNGRALVYNMQVYPGSKNTNPKISAVKCELDKVLSPGSLCRRNNLREHFCTRGKAPLDPNEVIKGVTAMIAQDFKYSEDRYNAEYYVTRAKYGEGMGFSSQAIEALLRNRATAKSPKSRKVKKSLVVEERKRIAQELYGISFS